MEKIKLTLADPDEIDRQGAHFLFTMANLLRGDSLFVEDRETSEKLLTAAAEAGSVEARAQLNWDDDYEPDTDHAGEQIQVTVSAPESIMPKGAAFLFQMGQECENGGIFRKDMDAAFQFYTEATEAGNADACNAMGWHYHNGLGTEQDLEVAENFYKKAAGLGSVTALVNLGVMYVGGMLGKPDPDKFFPAFQMAAEAGNSDGIWCYCDAVLDGWGGERELEEARRLLSLPDETAEPDVYLYRGILAEKMDGDPEAARAYFIKGGELGSAYCCNEAGRCLATGVGGPEDMETACRWYLTAGDLGDVLAWTNLGWMYESGDGGVQDLEKAVRWYTAAAEQGEEHAIEALKRLGRPLPDMDEEWEEE